MKHSVGWLKAATSLACCGVVSLGVAISGVGKSAVSAVGSTAALLLVYDLVSSSAEARPGGRGGRGGHRGYHRGHRGNPSKASPRRRHGHAHRERANRRHNRAEDRYRHRRRVVRRRHALGFLYAATLPRGCTTVVTVSGVRYYHCGGVYYRPYVDSGTTIYVIKE